MKKFQKRIGAFALMMALLLNLTVAASAVDNTNADRLHNLGLFRGNGVSYALEDTSIRIHGLIMLIRLLGEEDQALSSAVPCYFNDVTNESYRHYAGYAFLRGYTTGTSSTTFSPNQKIGFKHYVTFLLRALGYNDQIGDFSFNQCLDKAVEIGMMDAVSAQKIAAGNPTFYRKDMVDLSVSALTMEMKDGSGTLAEALVKRGVFTQEQGRQEKVIGVGKIPYTYTGNGGTPQPPTPVVTGAISRQTAAYNVPSGTVSADIITVDLRDPAVKVRSAMVDNRLGHTANFADIVNGSGAQVVINANFFDAYNASKFPIGHVMVNGSFLYGNSGLTSVGFTKSGEVYFGRPAVFFYVNGQGQEWACYEKNTMGQAPSTSVLYDSAFGDSVTLLCDGVITTVVNGEIQSSSSEPAGAVIQIPANGFVMFFGHEFAATDYYRSPRIGSTVKEDPRLFTGSNSDFPLSEMVSMVSGAPRLVENGQICTTLEPGFTEARFTTVCGPRTAVGKLADGKLAIISTSAATVQQMRELALQLGCVDAVNLDGGASTALAYQGKIVRNAGRPLTATLQISVG